MNSYSLSVYRITLNKHLKKDILENLSNFDNGKDFLSLIDMMFSSWKKDENDNNIIKDENAKKVSRLKKDAQGNWIYHRHQTYIDGIIESGDYGTQESIIDIETGKPKYTKTPKDAALVPFYFMIYIEPNTPEGFLILERIGNIGILSVLDKAIRKVIGENTDDLLTLRIEPYVVPQLLRINLAAVGGAKRVVLKGVKDNQFKEKITAHNFAGCRTEVSFIAPKNKFIQEITKVIDSLKGKKPNESYKVNNVECLDVAFELDVNCSRRTISLAKMTNIGMNVDITKNVIIDETGYPVYSSLLNEANVILSYLVKK